MMLSRYPLIREGEAALAARVAVAWKAEPVRAGPQHHGLWWMVRNRRSGQALVDPQVTSTPWEQIAEDGVIVARPKAEVVSHYHALVQIPLVIVVQAGWKVFWWAMKSEDVRAAMAGFDGDLRLPASHFRPLAQGK